MDKRDFLKNKSRFFVLRTGGEFEVYKTEQDFMEREAPIFRTQCHKLKIKILSEKDNIFAFCHSIKDRFRVRVNPKILLVIHSSIVPPMKKHIKNFNLFYFCWLVLYFNVYIHQTLLIALCHIL